MTGERHLHRAVDIGGVGERDLGQWLAGSRVLHRQPAGAAIDLVALGVFILGQVQARQIVDLGDIPPEQVVTPGIYVDRVVEVANPSSEREMIENDIRYPAGGSK